MDENGKQRYIYTYDGIGRIISEKDLYNNEEVCYTYDNKGNILTKSVNGTITEYKYQDGTDRLMRFGTETFEYDDIGNPEKYRGKTCRWENGRQLKSITDGTNTVTFTYNAFGMRTGKTSGGSSTSYLYENGKLLRQITGSEKTDFIYGSDGVIGFVVGTASYLYRKNVFGDVTEIYNASGTLVGKYRYTAFGECTVELDTNGIATKNPIRYRGYYYDTETGLYYLKSRYYDPVVGRFIQIDSIEYIDPETINGLNLYAYCANNPVMNVDPSGMSWWEFWKWDWMLIGTVVASVAIVIGALAVSVATVGALTVLGAMVSGFFIGGLIGGTFELGAQLIDGNGLDWKKIGYAALGAGFASAISAIPGLGWGATFAVGGAASIIGGLITGSVVDGSTALLSFGIGGLANIAAKGISDLILNEKASQIANMSNKAKSLAVQRLEGHSLNMGAQALKGSMRNAFKNITKNEIKILLKNADSWLRLGIYASLFSSFLSSFPFAFK